MITTDILTCSTMLIPPDGGREVQNWVTRMTCYLPPSPGPWTFGWDGVIAIATIIAVGVSVTQAFIATKQASKAREQRDESERLRRADAQKIRFEDQERDFHNQKDETYRRASRLSVWTQIDRLEDGKVGRVLHIRNGQYDSLYNLVIKHDGLRGGEMNIPLIAPGYSDSFDLPLGKSVHIKGIARYPAELVHIEFNDALGNRFRMDPENEGILTDLGPCS